MSKNLNLLFVSICVVISISVLFAGTTGKIAGRVTDEVSGEPLAGVNIVLMGTSMGAATDIDGNYTILNISPGLYSIKAMMIGYAPMVIEEVRVNVDVTKNLPFTLKVESIIGEEVVVVAERKIIKMDVASSQANISAQEIDDLPVTDVEGVIGLQAGAEGLSIRKGGEDELAMLVDGVSLKDDRTGRPITGVPLSSVQEIMITSGGFSAEYSDLQAGVVNVVTKEGSSDKYTFNLNYKYSPPAQKHFGISIYDPNSIYLRPFLDDDVCWNGTYSETYTDKNGNQQWDEGEPFEDRNNDGVYYNSPWDKYTQARYPSFEGWNAVSEELIANNDSTDNLSPLGAKRLFEWQHRRQGDITKPDYNIDFGIGGPVPFVSEMLGNLRFFSSFRAEKDMFMVPLKRDAYKEWSWNNKITSDITDKIKLQITTFMKETETVSSSETGLPNWFSSISSVANVFGSSSQQRSKIFYPDYYCATDISTRVVSGKMIHILSQKSFYETGFEYSKTSYLTGPGEERNQENIYDLFPGDYDFYVNEAPWGFETSLASKSIDGFMMGAKANARDSSETSRFNINFDMVSQINQTNQFKYGFVYNSWQYDMNYGAINPDLPVGRPYSNWQKNPWQFDVYAMDKIEYEGWIANIGIRAEYFNPNTEWYEVDAYNQSLFSSLYKDDKDEQIPKQKAKSLLTLLPRIGINHPITINSKLYFNYGHMRQRFQPDQLFGVRRVTGGQMSSFGNPELPMEKTVMYELGYDHVLFGQYLFHAATYYKDKSDQAGSISYLSADNTVDYSQYANIFYQDVRGLELELRKNRGNWLTGFVNYTYAVYSSGYFGTRMQYQNPSEQRKYSFTISNQAQSKPIPQPELHFNIAFHSPGFQSGSMLNRLLFSGWDWTFTGIWEAGAYSTFGNVLGITNNVRWKDYYNVNMKISKTIQIEKLRITAITDIYNVFNFKHFSSASYGDQYLTPEIYRQYTESLHFSKKVYDELGEKFIPGNDKLGDYRPFNVDFQPMDYVNKISGTFTGDRSIIYLTDQITLDRLFTQNEITNGLVDLNQMKNNYTIQEVYYDHDNDPLTPSVLDYSKTVITDFKSYVQMTANGDYDIVSKKKINKILDDKAYIFNPANEAFMFLAPRDIYFGIRISYEL